MVIKRVFITGLRILGVCLLFAVCFLLSAAISGLDKVGSQGTPATPAQQPVSSPVSTPPNPPTPQMPEGFLSSFLLYSGCVGCVLSYLILRSRWHGWGLAAVVSLSMFGISTVASQVESVAFLSSKLPHGMIRAIFLQGAIAAAIFSPLAVLVLGKWRAVSSPTRLRDPTHLNAVSVLWRLTTLVAAFVFLYMFFGYYVAWRNPDVQQYYGGPDLPTFFAALKYNWQSARWIYALSALRALLYVACLYPLVRMLRASRRESALAMALFLAAWTTVLLMPNPLMPASVARSHFWETLTFSLVFGALTGWLLYPLGPTLDEGVVPSSGPLAA